MSAGADAAAGASRQVAEAADAWLTDPRDVEAYRRLVIAAEAWRARVRPVLPGTEHLGRRSPLDPPAPRDGTGEQPVLDPDPDPDAVPVQEQLDVVHEQQAGRAQLEQDVPVPDGDRAADRADQAHEQAEVPQPAGPEQVGDVPAPPAVGDLLRGADVREVLQRLRRG